MSPPLSPNGKSPSRSGPLKGVLLLLSLLLLILLIGGLIFFYLNSSDGDFPSSHPTLNNSQPHFDSSEISPIVGRPNQMGSLATETPATPATIVSTTVPTTARTTTVSLPEDQSVVVIEEEEEEEEEDEEEISNEVAPPKEEKTEEKETENEVETCAALPILRSSCGHVQRQESPPSPTPLSLLHYSLNLSTSYNTHFIGDSEIFVRPLVQTNQITLGASRNLRSLDSVTVFDCTSGEAICSTTQHDPSREVLSISLSSPSSSLLRIIITQYHSISAPSLYSQVPAAFNRQLPSVVGTHFQSDSDAKQLFPTVLGSGIRSSLSLCLFHDDSSSVSSSFPSDRDASARARRAAPEGKRTTCFERTKPIQQRDFAFLAHYKTESLFFNQTSSSTPELDVIFSFTQGFSPSHHEWIHEETHKVISAVSEWTSYGFPLPRLTLIDAPIPVSHSLSPLGFIVLKSGSLLGSPKVATMRNSLMRQVLSQWIGGVVSSEECVEDALVTYLQWRINDEIHFIAGQANTTEKVRETRPSSLVSKPKRGRLSLSSSCPDRLPSIFHSIDRIYGEGTIQRIVRGLFLHHSFSHVSLVQLALIANQVTGDETAGAYLRDWFTVSSRPLFLAKNTREGMEITQVAAPNKEVNLWRLPLEIDGSVVEIKPELNQFVPITSTPLDCLVIDPRRKSTAMIAYDVDTYQCLIRCSFSVRCSLSPTELDSIFSDLGVFFTSNLLPVEERQVNAWKSVLSSLHSRSSLQGDSKCCMDHSLRVAPSRDCAWTVNDICKKISLSSAVLSSP